MEQPQVIASKADLEKVSSQHKNKLIVLYFRADWAPQCKQVDDVLPDLMKDEELAHAVFFKVEAEQAVELSKEYNVTSVPTFILIMDKELLEVFEGMNIAEARRKIKAWRAKVDLLMMTTPIDSQTFIDKLMEITNRAPCVLLLDGTAEEPADEDGWEAVEILKNLKLPFTTYNAADDPGFRQHVLVRIVAAPIVAFPLLFVKGAFVGGIDTMRKLAQSGELAKMARPTELTKRLEALINQAPVMVFMKGTPEEPRCGFSRTLVEILRKSGIAYESFDILSDEEVRQGLKKHSNWPTYPQVYVKGSLVGGLDIIKELDENDELVSTLQG